VIAAVLEAGLLLKGFIAGLLTPELKLVPLSVVYWPPPRATDCGDTARGENKIGDLKGVAARVLALAPALAKTPKSSSGMWSREGSLCDALDSFADFAAATACETAEMHCKG
jgi:hypothetical protein